VPKRNISSSGLIFFRLVGPGPFHPPRAIIPICWDCPTSRRFFHSDRLGFRQKPPFSFQYVGIGQKSVFPQFQFVGIVHKSLVKRELQMIRCHSDLLGLAEKRWFLDSNLLGSRQKRALFHSNMLGFHVDHPPAHSNLLGLLTSS
jgi:hypothetical protein